MKLSKDAEKELLELTRSEALKKDMETIAAQRHNPFIKDGIVDVDAYLVSVYKLPPQPLPSREGLIYQPSPLTGEGKGGGDFRLYKQTLFRIFAGVQ